MTHNDHIKFAKMIASEIEFARRINSKERLDQIEIFKFIIAGIFNSDDPQQFNRQEFYNACEP